MATHRKGNFLFLIALSYLFSACLIANEQTLSFDEAVRRTLCLSPKLRIADSEINEMIGETIQSSVYPNPIASYSVENVFGNKHWKGWESADSRYEIAQLIELGGKRGYRQQTAKLQYYASQANYEAVKLALLNRLLKLFTTVVAAQESLQIAFEQTKIAEEVYKTVSTKVDAGKVSLIQQNKADIALASAQISLENAKTDFANSKQSLSILWGCPCPDFDQVCFPFYELEMPLPLEHCISDLRENPELMRSQMEYLAAHQIVHYAKSEAIPDVTVVLGYKTLQDTHNRGFILGASIPIPIFDRNQGNIERARSAANKSYEEYLDLELALENKLSVSYKDLLRAYQEAELIRTTVLKKATQSFELAKEGFREGKFEYLDMLDSQRTLFDIMEQYIQALLDYHHSKADIEYLNTQED